MKNRRLTIAVAESCTGGLIQKLITDVPGSSGYFMGGVVAYSNEFKQKLVGVRLASLKEYEAVSSEVAQEMARGIRKTTGADIGVSTTGIAGPAGGTADKPVGLVYIGVATKDIVKAERFLFEGNRKQIREQSAQKALMLVKEILL